MEEEGLDPTNTWMITISPSFLPILIPTETIILLHMVALSGSLSLATCFPVRADKTHSYSLYWISKQQWQLVLFYFVSCSFTESFFSMPLSITWQWHWKKDILWCYNIYGINSMNMFDIRILILAKKHKKISQDKFLNIRLNHEEKWLNGIYKPPRRSRVVYIE